MSTGNATGVLISAALPTAQYGRRSGNAEKQNPFGKAPHSYVPVLGHIKSDVKSAGKFFSVILVSPNGKIARYS